MYLRPCQQGIILLCRHLFYSTHSNWSRIYANFVSTWPSMITSGQFICTEVSGSEKTTFRGFALSKFAQLSIQSFGLSSVLIIPTWSLLSVLFERALFLLRRKSSVRAIWCSASTRLEMREISIRVINASSCSGERWCEESERPRAKEGMIAAL